MSITSGALSGLGSVGYSSVRVQQSGRAKPYLGTRVCGRLLWPLDIVSSLAKRPKIRLSRVYGPAPALARTESCGDCHSDCNCRASLSIGIRFIASLGKQQHPNPNQYQNQKRNTLRQWQQRTPWEQFGVLSRTWSKHLWPLFYNGLFGKKDLSLIV